MVGIARGAGIGRARQVAAPAGQFRACRLRPRVNP